MDNRHVSPGLSVSWRPVSADIGRCGLAECVSLPAAAQRSAPGHSIGPERRQGNGARLYCSTALASHEMAPPPASDWLQDKSSRSLMKSSETNNGVYAETLVFLAVCVSPCLQP